MNGKEQNGFAGSAIVEDTPEQVDIGAPPNPDGRRLFVSQKDKLKLSLKNEGRLLFIGAGIVLVLLLMAFHGISRRSVPAPKQPSENVKKQKTAQGETGDSSSASMTPILDTDRAPEQEVDSSRVNPDQIGRTANKQTKPTAAVSLGDVRPFESSQTWQPPPYQPGSETSKSAEDPATSAEVNLIRSEHDALDKASLVFVRNNASSATGQKSQYTIPQIDWAIGLPPGTRLRARLESAISSAVRTPVVAVIEFNYEQDGEIVIPAGAKAFGHLEAADRTGYVGIRFDSLLMPNGSSVNLEAAATDLQLRPLRGKVEGKHTGKNILVRSFAGVGEIAATLVGRGSLNQPFSEGDLLRERVSSNIGQASDQSVANFALSEHIVITIPAGTEIYVVLQKSATENVQSPRGLGLVQTANQPSVEELRQLMQLQRELDQTAEAKPMQ